MIIKVSNFQQTITEQEKAAFLRYLGHVSSAGSKDITPAMSEQGVFPLRWLSNLLTRNEPYMLMPNDERAEAIATAVRILTQDTVIRVIGVDESRERFNHRRPQDGALYQIIDLNKLLPAKVASFADASPYVPEYAPVGTPVAQWRAIKGHPGYEAGYTDTMQLIEGAIRPKAPAAA